MSMNRKLKILLVNILLVFILLAIAEAFCYFFEQYRTINVKDFGLLRNYSLHLEKFSDFYSLVERNYFRKPEGLGYKNKLPIVIFGCSYAYGDILKNEQTLSYKLSHYTKRPVYNRAFGGWGVHNMLYQLEKNDFYKKVPEPEYAVYVYIDAQLYRMYLHVYYPTDDRLSLRYKLVNGKLVEDNPLFPFLYKFYITKEIIQIIAREKAKNYNKSFDFMKIHFIQSIKAAKKHWKKTKFIILLYGTDKKDRWKELEKEGYCVVSTNELTNANLLGKKYTISEYDSHPNGEAWNIIVPAFSKYLDSL